MGIDRDWWVVELEGWWGGGGRVKFWGAFGGMGGNRVLSGVFVDGYVGGMA